MDDGGAENGTGGGGRVPNVPDQAENGGETSNNNATGVDNNEVVAGEATDEVPGEAAVTDAGEAATGAAEQHEDEEEEISTGRIPPPLDF